MKRADEALTNANQASLPYDSVTRTSRGPVRFGGLGGEAVTLTASGEPRDPDDHTPPTELETGGQGRYKVRLTLGRPGNPTIPENVIVFTDDTHGDSHLLISGGSQSHLQIRTRISDQEVDLVGYTNAKGRLAKLECELEASSFDDAEISVHRAVIPMLGYWSLQLDAPLHVSQIGSEWLGKGALRVSYRTPFLESTLPPDVAGHFSGDFWIYARLYSEALNSNSDVYRYLCFFKIIEGIYKRRERLDDEARRRGKTFPRPLELVPDAEAELRPWLVQMFSSKRAFQPQDLADIFPREARGRKFTHVCENFLRPLRVRIAHFLTNEGELTIASDDLLQLREVHKWLGLTRCVSRRMLMNEFPEDFKPTPVG